MLEMAEIEKERGTEKETENETEGTEIETQIEDEIEATVDIPVIEIDMAIKTTTEVRTMIEIEIPSPAVTEIQTEIRSAAVPVEVQALLTIGKDLFLILNFFDQIS